MMVQWSKKMTTFSRYISWILLFLELSLSLWKVSAFISNSHISPIKRVALSSTMDSITSGITLSASNSDTSSSEVTTARAKNNRNNSNNTDASSFDPTAASPPEPLPMVMEGGPAQIFAMARRMLLWDNMDVGTAEGAGGADVSPSTSKKTKATPLPRWHPHAGISDYNPSFREKAPAMNSLGYANAIRRNSRKRNKPAMWKYALRTYHRMNSTTIDATASSTTTTTSTSTSNMLGNQNKIRPKIPQRIIHHEGALVACAKLGNWEEAFRIFHAVEQQYDDQKKRIKRNKNNVKKSATTDHMVHSLVKACVKASRYQNKKSNSHSDANANSIIQKRREPLDRLVSDVISKLSTKYHLPVLSTHINPIAAAYQKLHLYDEAANVIETYLSNRTKRRYGSSSSSSRNNVKKYNIRSEEMDMVDDDDDDDYEDDDEDDDDDDDEDDEDEYEEDPKERKRFNVLDIGTKDRGSYSLLVKGAAQNGDWKKAVKALEEMTAAGVYPEKRCLNSWKEATERRGTNIYPWHDSER